MKLKRHPFFWLLIATVLIGSVGPVSRYILQEMPSMTAGAYRALIIGVIALFFVLKGDVKPLKKKLLPPLLLNVFFASGGIVLLFLALERTQAINISVILLLMPMFVYLGSVILLHETFNSRALLGVVISLIGSMFLVAYPVLQGGGFDSLNTGDILAITASIFFAGKVLQSKKLVSELTPVQLISIRSWSIFIVMMAIAIYQGQQLSFEGVPARTIVALLYLGLLAGGFGLILFYSALSQIRAEDASPALYFESLTGVMLSTILLGETLDDFALVASGIVVMGVLVAHPAHLIRFHAYHVHDHKPPWLQRLIDFGKKVGHELAK